MKEYKHMTAITQLGYKAQEIAKKFIEHNQKNQSEKDYDYLNEELLYQLLYYYKEINGE
tara:strand:- start:190 stop:366 length:177 start_codon:yes stop_codon:yes gene_type:complete